MPSFERLTRTAMRKLQPGESIAENGIVFTRLAGDGRWSINCMVNRVRHHVVVGLESEGYTRTQAEELIATLKAKKAERRHGIVTKRAGVVTFKAATALYLQHLRDTGGKDIAKKEKRLDLHLIPKLGNLALGSLTESDLRRYSTTRENEGATAATINRELAVVSHLLNTAIGREGLNLLTAAPCRIPRLAEPLAPPVYLTPDQAAALLKKAAEDSNPFVYTFAMIGLHTGMRRESILRLRVGDLDLERRIIWIERDKAGERQQPMTADLAEHFREHLKQLPEGCVWVFPSNRSKTGHAVNINKAFDRIVVAAGLSGNITPHKLRHTMATNAAHAGVDAPTLQAMGGWKSRRMVERYTHAGDMREAMAKLQGAYDKRTVTQKLQKRSRKARK